MNLRNKIQERLDRLENALRDGKHLSAGGDQGEVEALVHSISKFHSILSDEDRDFVMAAKLAIAERSSWI